MKTTLDMVREFHVATGNPVLPRPGVPPHDRVRLRCKLVLEEALELIGAMIGFDQEYVKRMSLQCNYLIDQIDPQSQLNDVAKEMADLAYVLAGSALEFGVPLDKVLEAVHENNMLKVNGPRRADGKVMKNPNHPKVDIGSILDFHA